MGTSIDSQYKRAIASDAICTFEINLSKDSIEEEVFISMKDDDGQENRISVSQFFGLGHPCKFSTFTKLWCENIISDTDLEESEKLDYTKYPKLLIQKFNDEEYSRMSEYWTTEFLGRKFYMREGLFFTKAENGDIMALAVIKDLTKIREIEEETKRRELEYYVYTDSTTGGENYARFKDEIHELGTPGYMVAMDIYSFKIINSACGVTKGDQVINAIWKSLRNVLGKDVPAGHINADRFVFLMHEEKNEESEEKIKRTLAQITMTLNFLSIELDIPQLAPYFGISYWNQNERIELCYNQAVAAKHKIKGRKDVNVAFFNKADTDRLVFEKQLEDAFDSALRHRRFEIWYQPKYNPVTKVLVGAEALVRWRKEDGSLIPPSLFIPIFERNGMIKNLDEYVFTTVCEQQKRWLDKGMDIIPISINLSRTSLYFKNVVSHYRCITDKIGIDPNYVPIELTESAAVSTKDMEEIAKEFYRAGFPLHMDDFGTGYSSLASLNTMHFDTLKIDKSLIDFIGNYGGERLLEHTIALAKELGMHVTAEGVENNSQVEFLQNLNCDSIQGFYFSRPLQTESFEKSLIVSSVIDFLDKNHSLEKTINNLKLPTENDTMCEYVVNLSQNTVVTTKGISEWLDDVGNKETRNFTDETKFIAKNLILEKYRTSYLAAVDREHIMKSSIGNNEIRSMEYERLYKGSKVRMRLTMHIFRIEKSEDLWMFMTVVNVSGKTGFGTSASRYQNLDLLTTTYNRQYIMDEIRRNIAEERMVAIILADIDEFKEVNRKFGHKFGDDVLRDLTHRMKDFFSGMKIGRVEGDKFLIIYDIGKNSADSYMQRKSEAMENLDSLLSNFRKKVSRVFYKNGSEVPITVSTGYAIFPDDETDLDSLLSSMEVKDFPHGS